MADTLPSPTPAPTPAPTPTPTPAPTPEPSQPSVVDNLMKYADIHDNKVSTRTAQPPQQQPKPKPAEPAKPAQTPAPTVDPKLAKQPDKPPQAAPKPADATDLPAETEIGKMAPKPLREAYGRATSQLKAVQKELAELKGKPVPEHPEYAKLKGDYDGLQKKFNDSEEKLRFTNFRESSEYQTKYLDPFTKAFADGREMMGKLKVTNAETGDVRQLTAQDFDNIMSIQDHMAAADAIDALGLTGARAQMVISARDRVRNIWGQMEAAEKDYRENGAKIEKERKDASDKRFATLKTETGAAFEKFSKQAIEDYGIKFDKDDEAGNEQIRKGLEGSKRAFSNMNPYDPALNAEQREAIIKGHAEVYFKAAAFERLKSRHDALQTKLTELEEKLKGYEASEPTDGDNRPPKPAEDGGGDVTSRLQRFADRAGTSYVT